MARENGIACDFCGKALTDRPQTLESGGWNYVWSQTEFGSASFAYATCADCCDVEHDYLTRATACVTRAKRHGRTWGRNVDRFIVDYIDQSLINGTVVMKHLASDCPCPDCTYDRQQVAA